MPITEAELRKLVSQISRVPEGRIRPDSRFAGELRMDSLATTDLLTSLEDDYAIVITQDEARTLETFGALLAHINGS